MGNIFIAKKYLMKLETQFVQIVIIFTFCLSANFARKQLRETKGYRYFDVITL